MKDATDITIVLDRSGSMSSVRDDTIGGFNTFLHEQRKVPGDASVSLAQFDDVYEVVYAGTPLESTPALTRESFIPRSNTALLDAIGRTIEATGTRLGALSERERPDKVVFVIVTDGFENASREWTREKVLAAITHQREKYNWQFVFLGANQDAIATAASMGIATSSSLTYAANARGTISAFKATASNVIRYRTGVLNATSFEPSDAAEQTAASDQKLTVI